MLLFYVSKVSNILDISKNLDLNILIKSQLFYSRLITLWESEDSIKDKSKENLGKVIGKDGKAVSSWRKSLPNIATLYLIIKRFPHWSPFYLIGLSDQKYIDVENLKFR